MLNPQPLSPSAPKLLSPSAPHLLLTLLTLFLSTLSPSAPQTVTPLSPGDNWTLALEGAGPGDEFIFEEGTFTGPCGAVVLSDIRLRGQGADRSILDCAGTGTRVLRVEGATVRVEGLGMRGGGVESSGNGGCVYLLGAELHLQDAEVSGCKGSWGAGIFVSGSKVNITRTKIFSNIVANNGGGVLAEEGSEVKVWDSVVVQGNQATNGAGFSIQSSSTLEMYHGVEVKENTGVGGWGEGGGAVYLSRSQAGIWHDVTISDNYAHEGAGLLVVGGVLVLRDKVTVKDNRGGCHGAGIALKDSSSANFTNEISILNNRITGTGRWCYGGGVYLHSGSSLLAKYQIVISNNKANYAGSGIGSMDGNRVELSDGVLVQGNEGSEVGGGVWSDDSAVTLNPGQPKQTLNPSP